MDEPAGSAESHPILPRWRQIVILLIMLAASVFSQIDRQIVNILLEPIKHELNASDTQMGLLSGLYYVAFYALAGIPIARLADTGSRRAIIAVCVATWSIATTLSGLARSYTQLAAARVFVAAGEGGVTPAMYSLAADVFPLRNRTKVVAVISGGTAIGAGLGILLGGTLSASLGWRQVFLIVGLPGLLLAPVALFLLPEPRREAADRQPPQPFLPVAAALWRKHSFRWLALAAACGGAAGFGVLAWTPAFLARIHGLDQREIGLALGSATVIGLLFGNLTAGVLADQMARRDVRWLIWTAGIGLLLSIPAGAVFLLSGSPTAAILGFAGFTYFLAFWPPSITGVAISIADRQSRALASAFLFLFVSAGGAVGPFLIGFLNDLARDTLGASAIRVSLATSLLECLASGLICLALGASVRRDLSIDAADPL